MAQAASSYEEWALGESMGIRCLVPFDAASPSPSPPRLAVVTLPGDERGLMVVRRSDASVNSHMSGVAVPAGSRILSVPFASLLSLEDLPRSPFAALLSGEEGSIAEDDALALLLLYEIHELGQSSRFWPHLEILPKAYHSIPNFTIEELEWIRGSNLYYTALAWKRQIEEDFAALTARTIDLGGARGRTVLSSAYSWLTLPRYVWALSTIWSRFVTVDRKDKKSGEDRRLRCMVPLFDLMNHAPGSGTSHYFDGASDAVVLYTADAIPAGTQIMLNYGRLGNDKLLKVYGFVIPPSVGNDSYDNVGVYTALHPDTPLFAHKRQLLVDLGLPVDGRSPLEVKRGELPRDLMRFVRVQRAVSGNDLLRLLADGGEYIADDVDTASSVLALEVEVTEAVLSALRGMLAQYPFDIDEDRRALLSWGLLLPVQPGSSASAPTSSETASAEQLSNATFVHPSERLKSAVVLRFSEMTILSNAIDELEEYAASLPGAT